MRPTWARPALALAAAAFAILGVSCSEAPVAAQSGDDLVTDVTYTVDLDGDGTHESIRIDSKAASLAITDGETVYRSRDKWRLVDAALGDTDRDGLLEIVALLDSEEGRHLGMFAFFGGEYRERLVTNEFDPPPLTLRVLPGDLLELTAETAAGQGGPRTTLYRWNGFGFTAVDPTTSPLPT